MGIATLCFIGMNKVNAEAVYYYITGRGEKIAPLITYTYKGEYFSRSTLGMDINGTPTYCNEHWQNTPIPNNEDYLKKHPTKSPTRLCKESNPSDVGYAYIIANGKNRISGANNQYYVTQFAIHWYKDRLNSNCPDNNSGGKKQETFNKGCELPTPWKNTAKNNPNGKIIEKLVNDAQEYAKKSNYNFSLVLNFTDASKNYFDISTDGNYYISGGIKATYLSQDLAGTVENNIKLSINDNTIGAEIVDGNGNKISSVTPGGVFYVRVPVARADSTSISKVQVQASGSANLVEIYQYNVCGRKTPTKIDGGTQNVLIPETDSRTTTHTLDIKFECLYDNPNHFHKPDDENGDHDLEQSSFNKSHNCCTYYINKYKNDPAKLKQLYIDYPICNPRKSEPQVFDLSCKQDERTKKTLAQDGTWENTEEEWDSIAANKTFYNTASATKYCTIYCREKIDADFPSSYQILLNAGASFQWPSYNKNGEYYVSMTGTLQCKIKVRLVEWRNAYNKASASKKQELINDLQNCNAQANGKLNGIQYNFEPSLTVSQDQGYNNKIDTVNLVASGTKEESRTNLTGTTAFSLANLDAWAAAIRNKVSQIVVKVNYVLESGHYQYASDDTNDEDTGSWLKSLGNQKNVKDTGASHLIVSQRAKVDTSHPLELKYNKLSGAIGTVGEEKKYSIANKKYSCEYKVGKQTASPSCDINELNHFMDRESGPNGEDCYCEIYNTYGDDSEQWKKVIEYVNTHGWNIDLSDMSSCSTCDLNNPDNFSNGIKNPDRTDPEGGNCCNTLSPDSYLYKKYNCPGDEPYCPGDCDGDRCVATSMTLELRDCMNNGGTYDECKVDRCPIGGNIVIYRPIDMELPFPGTRYTDRTKTKIWKSISNWSYKGTNKNSHYYVDEYINDNRGKDKEKIYSYSGNDIMYTIKLDSKTIKQIKNGTYGSMSYDDFKCTDSEGKPKSRQCRSQFVKRLAEAGIVTGCGTSSKWDACPGVGAEKGDM